MANHVIVWLRITESCMGNSKRLIFKAMCLCECEKDGYTTAHSLAQEKLGGRVPGALCAAHIAVARDFTGRKSPAAICPVLQ